MLLSLHIRNYALIEKLDLEPHRAFNVITGETGAGKSIMLGALGLLLGGRVDKKVLLNENEKCVIEAHFDISAYHLQNIFAENDLDYENTATIRREISSAGKSRAFINDTPVNLETLSQITSQLIDIHSQHDNLLLSAESYQRNIIDIFAENLPLLAEYQALFQDYLQKNKFYQSLLTEKNQAQAELDYHKFLLEELLKAALQEDEQEELEAEFGILENAEEIKTKLAESLYKLQESESSVLSSLKAICRDFEKMSEFSSIYEELAERLENTLTELKDITREVERLFGRTEYNPERLAWVQKRLDEIERLQKKHRVKSVQELLQIQQDLQNKVERVLNFDEILEKAEKAMQIALQKATEKAQLLSEKRKAVVSSLENELQKLLSELGMPNARLQIQILPAELYSGGGDKVIFLFSANKGIAPQEIKNVASGGEFSRLMLAIKYILAGKTAMPTLIFDEIDTGISGEIALKMALMMKEMAKNHQIITITHLHQIAAKAEKHYFVFKEDTEARTISRIKELSYEERLQEIAQMISGIKNSTSALQSAKELLGSK
jgi:DNA repair protein RecN (Recombination protein N)